MSNRTLGRRYAKALFELSVESQSVNEVKQSVAALQQLWAQSTELRMTFADPGLSQQTAQRILSELLARLGAHPLVITLTKLLADRGRLGYLADVLSAFDELAEEYVGEVRVEVDTSVPMSEDFYRSLISVLQPKTDSKITLIKREDPSLIGGIVVRVGDKVFDGSLSNRLVRIKENLLRAHTSA